MHRRAQCLQCWRSKAAFCDCLGLAFRVRLAKHGCLSSSLEMQAPECISLMIFTPLGLMLTKYLHLANTMPLEKTVLSPMPTEAIRDDR